MATPTTAATLVPAVRAVQPLTQRVLRPVAQVAPVASSLWVPETPARVALAAAHPVLAALQRLLAARVAWVDRVRPSAAMVELAALRHSLAPLAWPRVA